MEPLLVTDKIQGCRERGIYIIPDYWERACQHLSSRDRIMKRLIHKHKGVFLESRGNAFVTLARSIVGQQITVKAAQSIWERMTYVISQGEVEPTPEDVLATSTQQLKDAGLPKRKIEYLQDLAIHFSEKKLCSDTWHEMSDEAIVADLTKIRGVGRWTAEMFLIFYLLRPNVFPLDDIGILRSISLNYFSGEAVSRAEARELGEAWAPYRTVAVWYLWRSLDPLPVTY